jgi:CRP-like cAMP-binding protein
MLDNHLLENLTGALAADVRRRLTPLDYVSGDILAEPNTPIDSIIFPRSGLISIVVALDCGDQVEVGIIGRRGMLGGSAILGAERHLHMAICQLSGAAWTMRVADAMEVAAASAEFRELFLAQEQYLLAEARQFGACNAKHLLTQRLCSWLLRAHEEAGASELLITQELMAKMLGVQRASVSMLAGQLQDEEFIGYRRGRISVLNPDGLRERSCSCHRVLKEQYERLFESRSYRGMRAEGRDTERPTDGPSPD